MKKIVVVTVNFNTEEDTNNFLHSLEQVKISGFLLETIVVDNGSSKAFHLENKGSKKYHPVLLRLEENTGFSGGYNLGIKEALARKADYILVINNDTLVDPDMLVYLFYLSETDSQIGVAVPKIYFAKGHEFHKNRYQKMDLGKVFWFAGGYFDWNNIKSVHRGVDEVDHGQYDKAEKIDFASGAAC
jgi:GT2 family glycosyltransferase